MLQTHYDGICSIAVPQRTLSLSAESIVQDLFMSRIIVNTVIIVIHTFNTDHMKTQMKPFLAAGGWGRGSNKSSQRKKGAHNTQQWSKYLSFPNQSVVDLPISVSFLHTFPPKISAYCAKRYVRATTRYAERCHVGLTKRGL